MAEKQDDPVQAQLARTRKAQILEAATKVFAAKGFARATIKEIAREAGLADGTIYLYFANKDALLIGLLELLNETEERDVHFAESAKMDIGDFTRMYLRHRYHEINKMPGLFRVLLTELLINEELRDQYFQKTTAPTMELGVGYFEQWMREGLIKPLDPYLTASAMAALFLGIFVMQELGDTELIRRQDEIPDFLATLMLDGLRPEKPDDDPNRDLPEGQSD